MPPNEEISEEEEAEWFQQTVFALRASATLDDAMHLGNERHRWKGLTSKKAVFCSPRRIDSESRSISRNRQPRLELQFILSLSSLLYLFGNEEESYTKC